MDKPSSEMRQLVGKVANEEARRRAMRVAKVGMIVIVTVLATLVFSGHRLAPDCVRAWVCMERGGAYPEGNADPTLSPPSGRPNRMPKSTPKCALCSRREGGATGRTNFSMLKTGIAAAVATEWRGGSSYVTNATGV